LFESECLISSPSLFLQHSEVALFESLSLQQQLVAPQHVSLLLSEVEAVVPVVAVVAVVLLVSGLCSSVLIDDITVLELALEDEIGLV
jgi:hypothetical protein